MPLGRRRFTLYLNFQVDRMRRQEICLQNVRRQNECMQPAIDLIRDGLPVDDLVTHRYAFADAKEGFDLVADYRDGVMKAVIELDG